MILRFPLLMCGGLVAVLATGPRVPAAVSARAPQAQAPAVFSSTTNLVQVDVIVHDNRDQFVLGLTADDLELYEDGRPQRIQQLYMVRTDPDTGLVSIDGGPAARSNRVFILVFDESDLETSALQRIKKGAEDFITTQFRDGDLGGVIVQGQFYKSKLTMDQGLLLSAVRAVKPGVDSRESRLRAFREFPRIPGEAEAIRIVGGDAFLLQDLGEQACREDAQQCNQDGGLQQVQNKLQQKARSYLGQARDATRYTLDALQLATRAIAPIPGRKTVVLLSDGFFVEESRELLQQMSGLAARAGATIYGVDGRGLAGTKRALPDVMTQERPLSGTMDTGADGPEMLANGTGGFVVRNTDDVARALARIARDTSSYYVLGYQPANGVMDGKFRQITVKARNASLNIRSRKGYVASPLPAQILKK